MMKPTFPRTRVYPNGRHFSSLLWLFLVGGLLAAGPALSVAEAGIGPSLTEAARISVGPAPVENLPDSVEEAKERLERGQSWFERAFRRLWNGFGWNRTTLYVFPILIGLIVAIAILFMRK